MLSLVVTDYDIVGTENIGIGMELTNSQGAVYTFPIYVLVWPDTAPSFTEEMPGTIELKVGEVYNSKSISVDWGYTYTAKALSIDISSDLRPYLTMT